jgi:hypothetical protein
MKVQKRNTKRRIITNRIGSPEFKREGDKVRFLLSYVDDQAFCRTLTTTKELFAYAAGTNEEGQLPEGLDRLLYHQFIIHVDDQDKAIGIDVIPSKSYRGVVPVKGADINTVRLEYLLGGAVCVVAHKPYKVRPSIIISLLAQLDKQIAAGKAITLSTKLPGIGKIHSVDSDAIEVKLSSGRGSGQPMYDLPIDED